MAPPTNIVCTSCTKSHIQGKEYLKCSICNSYYYPQCTGISIKMFYLMTKEKKNVWKCKVCRSASTSKSLQKETTNQRKSLTENVTFRSKQRRPNSESRISLESSKQSDISEQSMSVTSLPDLSTQDYDKFEDLKNIIESLNSQLESAHNQIDELVIENGSLGKKIAEQDLKIKLLMNIASTSSVKKNDTKKKMLPRKKKVALQSGSIETETDLNKSYHDLMGEIQIRDCEESQEQINLQNTTDSSTQTEENCIETAPKNINNVPEDCQKTIWIFGGQRSVGLASRLINSRQNTQYEKYNISSATKPNASSEEILKRCQEWPIQKTDKIILGVGEHDKNPNKVICELYKALNLFKLNDVLVLNVVNNKHLNEAKMNYELRMLCKIFPNVTFIAPPGNSRYKPANTNNTLYTVNETCKELNVIIDYLDYKSKYLNFKKIKSNGYVTSSVKNHKTLMSPTHSTISKIKNQLPTEPVAKKGTIPYYYPIISKNTKISEPSTIVDGNSFS